MNKGNPRGIKRGRDGDEEEKARPRGRGRGAVNQTQTAGPSGSQQQQQQPEVFVPAFHENYTDFDQLIVDIIFPIRERYRTINNIRLLSEQELRALVVQLVDARQQYFAQIFQGQQSFNEFITGEINVNANQFNQLYYLLLFTRVLDEALHQLFSRNVVQENEWNALYRRDRILEEGIQLTARLRQLMPRNRPKSQNDVIRSHFVTNMNVHFSQVRKFQIAGHQQQVEGQSQTPQEIEAEIQSIELQLNGLQLFTPDLLMTYPYTIPTRDIVNDFSTLPNIKSKNEKELKKFIANLIKEKTEYFNTTYTGFRHSEGLAKRNPENVFYHLKSENNVQSIPRDEDIFVYYYFLIFCIVLDQAMEEYVHKHSQLVKNSLENNNTINIREANEVIIILQRIMTKRWDQVMTAQRQVMVRFISLMVELFRLRNLQYNQPKVVDQPPVGQQQDEVVPVFAENHIDSEQQIAERTFPIRQRYQDINDIRLLSEQELRALVVQLVNARQQYFAHCFQSQQQFNAFITTPFEVNAMQLNHLYYLLIFTRVLDEALHQLFIRNVVQENEWNALYRRDRILEEGIQLTARLTPIMPDPQHCSPNDVIMRTFVEHMSNHFNQTRMSQISGHQTQDAAPEQSSTLQSRSLLDMNKGKPRGMKRGNDGDKEKEARTRGRGRGADNQPQAAGPSVSQQQQQQQPEVFVPAFAENHIDPEQLIAERSFPIRERYRTINNIRLLSEQELRALVVQLVNARQEYFAQRFDTQQPFNEFITGEINVNAMQFSQFYFLLVFTRVLDEALHQLFSRNVVQENQWNGLYRRDRILEEGIQLTARLTPIMPDPQQWVCTPNDVIMIAFIQQMKNHFNQTRMSQISGHQTQDAAPAQGPPIAIEHEIKLIEVQLNGLRLFTPDLQMENPDSTPTRNIVNEFETLRNIKSKDEKELKKFIVNLIKAKPEYFNSTYTGFRHSKGHSKAHPKNVYYHLKAENTAENIPRDEDFFVYYYFLIFCIVLDQAMAAYIYKHLYIRMKTMEKDNLVNIREANEVIIILQRIIANKWDQEMGEARQVMVRFIELMVELFRLRKLQYNVKD